MTTTTASRTRIIKTPEVMMRTQRSRTWLWRAGRAGDFPKPVQMSARSVGWYEHEVEAWLLARPRAAAYVADSTKSKKCESPAGGQALRGGTVNGNNYKTT